MANPYLGEIRLFAGNYAPQGWALCNGGLLPIDQNAALFILIGTTYGGNGVTTFALPDLRGRVPIHQGQAPGLSPYVLGAAGGEETVSLTAAQMPEHLHTLRAANVTANSRSPALSLPAISTYPAYTSGDKADVTVASGAVKAAGEGAPHENRQPHLAVNYILSLTGLYPTPG